MPYCSCAHENFDFGEIHDTRTFTIHRLPPYVCEVFLSLAEMQDALADTSKSFRSVLLEADALINGARRDDYGDVYDSFNTIALLWSAVLGMKVTAEHVALCMIELKIARYMNGKQHDSVVDIAGYAGCLEKIADRRAREGGLR